jgi:hypothetical protein
MAYGGRAEQLDIYLLVNQMQRLGRPYPTSKIQSMT